MIEHDIAVRTAGNYGEVLITAVRDGNEWTFSSNTTCPYGDEWPLDQEHDRSWVAPYLRDMILEITAGDTVHTSASDRYQK